ncbi:MAG: hypothetical protein BA874_03935 [Desulfuromonadales bacterium C00003068]|jgi:predicted transcriptional regulator|nr:MAG: hypothetical protein BA874_03935 [Desulfuromonadales bacterium C00003068]
MKTTTVRMDDQLVDRVDGIAKSLSRSRSWIIKQALERYVDYEEWYVKEVENALLEVEHGEVSSDQEVATVFDKWGVDAR